MWILTGEQLDRFKAMDEGEFMESKMLSYREQDALMIRFRMQLQRNMNGSQYTGFNFEILDHISFFGIAGIYGVSIDEVDWYLNEVFFNRETGIIRVSSFEDSLLMSVSTLTYCSFCSRLSSVLRTVSQMEVVGIVTRTYCGCCLSQRHRLNCYIENSKLKNSK